MIRSDYCSQCGTKNEYLNGKSRKKCKSCGSPMTFLFTTPAPINKSDPDNDNDIDTPGAPDIDASAALLEEDEDFSSEEKSNFHTHFDSDELEPISPNEINVPRNMTFNMANILEAAFGKPESTDKKKKNTKRGK